MLRQIKTFLLGITLALCSVTGFAAADNPYALVLFYQSSCPHCQKFTPIVAEVAHETGMKLYAFTMDGATLPAVSADTMPARDDITSNFYQGLSREVPAVFLVNVNTMAYLPISIGEEPENTFINQLQQALHSMAQPK